MNITNIAKKWLTEHEHYEDDPIFQDDLISLCQLLETVAYYEGLVGYEPDYDPNFGDDRLCLCGHPYYRHFDPFENNDPVGCKYCHDWNDSWGDNNCPGFKEKVQ